MEKTGVLSKTAYDFSKKVDVIQTIVIALLAFLVPTFLGKLLYNSLSFLDNLLNPIR